MHELWLLQKQKHECQHDNCGTSWNNGVKQVECLNCKKIIYRSNGNDLKDHLAYGG